jgi:hypothetical protein
MTTLVRAVDSKVPLDQVFFCGLVHRVLLAPLRSGQSLDPELAHDREDQLLVDDHLSFTYECRSDSQHPVGPTRSLVNVGDQIRQHQTTNLAVAGHRVLVLVEARS